MKKYYLLTFNEDWADEHDVPALAVMDEERFERWKQSKFGRIHAWLGNGGDGFDEQFEEYEYCHELITAGIVNVFEVSEDFAETFKRAHLERLSLSNVFEGGQAF